MFLTHRLWYTVCCGAVTLVEYSGLSCHGFCSRRNTELLWWPCPLSLHPRFPQLPVYERSRLYRIEIQDLPVHVNDRCVFASPLLTFFLLFCILMNTSCLHSSLWVAAGSLISGPGQQRGFLLHQLQLLRGSSVFSCY